ncbi:fatty acid elongase [Fennellomyces sp. T-0311]|nr:fatty acid elongase [Fennellomyces sp. T-0311]
MPAGTPFPELYPVLMDWKTPVGAIILYLTSVQLLTIRVVRNQAKSQGKAAAPSGKVMTFFVLLHNLFLATYSGITFYHMSIGMHRARIRDAPMFQKVCDLDEYFWNDTLGYWGYLFYLSKFYEVVDTFIILLKGKKPSLLQEYHHSGAMITMWAGIRYRTTAIWIFVAFNSLIHTIMYTYYALTGLGIHPPGKKYITTLQITQFLLGMTIAVTYLLVPGCSSRPGEIFTLRLNLTYLMPLTLLFLDFARKTYGRRTVSKRTVKKDL